MKNILVVTGGAGFVGSNLIEELIKFKKYKIISLDNYSSGFTRNHIKNSKIKYLKGDTKKISNILKKYKKKYIPFFILENFLEFLKVLKELQIALILMYKEVLNYLILP